MTATAKQDEGTEVGRVKKNANEVLILRETTYEGHDLLDLRVFAVDAEGLNPKPTRKGVCCKRETWPAIAALLQEALGEERPS
jgi:hypothetical protein